MTRFLPATVIATALCPSLPPLLIHRKDGRVVKERDDLMSAMRYATMMLRHARTLDHYDYLDRDIVYPNLGIY
jgi:hypothetical protein